MTVYAPSTVETDPKKQNRSLQANAAATTANTTDIATNTTNIATNTTNIATNTSAISALQAGPLVSGVVAAKTDEVAATSTALATTPGRQQFHPSAAKAWVSFTGSTAVILSGYNVTSITRNGAGDYTVNFTTSFTSANYSWSGSCGPGAGASTGRFLVGPTAAPTASVFRFSIVTTAFAAADSDFVSIHFFGTQ